MRDVVIYNDIRLTQDEEGKYVVSQAGHKSYSLKEDSRTGLIIRILDSRCQAQERRYACANDIINSLEQKLDKIEASKTYRILHKFGLL